MLEPVTDRLQGRQALIVLDNFEHVLAAAAELGRFLAACPELTVQVTSRSALRLRGEREVPPSGSCSPACRLFTGDWTIKASEAAGIAGSTSSRGSPVPAGPVWTRPLAVVKSGDIPACAKARLARQVSARGTATGAH